MRTILLSCFLAGTVLLSQTSACGDFQGLHCISGSWDCPQTLFAPSFVTASRCDGFCCRCTTTSRGEELCTTDMLVPGATILINPNFPGCNHCPSGVRNDHQCVKQQTLGLPSPLNACGNGGGATNRFSPFGV